MNKTSSGKTKTKTPLKWRLIAWWHGYDLDDVKTKLSTSDDIPQTSKNAPLQPTKSFIDQQESEEQYDFEDKPTASYPQDDGEDLSGNDDSAIDVDDDIEFINDDQVVIKAVWDTDRAHVAQVFWGDGFCGPGGPENIINMTEPLSINSNRTIMVVGAGLGGPVRAMQKEYNTPVDGYESSKKLATDGMEMSQEAGVAQDAPIIHFDFENSTRFSRKYDRAYAKESMFVIANKSQLIQTIFDHLKKDGLFLLTEYVLSEKADQSSALFNKWRKLEPYEPRPVSTVDMEAYLEDAGFSIRVNEDITDFYLDLIVDARAHAKKIIDTMEADDVVNVTILKYMHNEAIFWDTRAKLLRKGDLKVVRYLAHKSP